MENLMITHHQADQQTDITVLKAAIHASLLSLILPADMLGTPSPQTNLH